LRQRKGSRALVKVYMNRLLCFTILTATCVGSEISVEPSSEELVISTEVSKSNPVAKAEKNLSGKAWLGVLGDPISEVLKAQLGIENGLVLRYIAPESPADKAGLEKFDVIKTVNGTEVTSQMELKMVMEKLNADDCIKLGVLTKGEEKVQEITLCSKPIASHETKGAFSSVENFLRLRISSKEKPEDSIQDPLEQEILEKSSNGRINFKSTSAVRLQDNEGSIEVQKVNDFTKVIVRDIENQIQFQGPWNTEEDFNNASPEIIERINKVSGRYKKIKSEIQ